jgi:hypothetical protein
MEHFRLRPKVRLCEVSTPTPNHSPDQIDFILNEIKERQASIVIKISWRIFFSSENSIYCEDPRSVRASNFTLPKYGWSLRVKDTSEDLAKFAV